MFDISDWRNETDHSIDQEKSMNLETLLSLTEAVHQNVKYKNIPRE
jgi:hypothetical protein